MLPIFALANAGIVLDRASFEAATETPVALAVALGLLIGKTVGLTLGVALAVRAGAERAAPGRRAGPTSSGVGALAGIGFTVSLFITELAYSDPDVIAAVEDRRARGLHARGDPRHHPAGDGGAAQTGRAATPDEPPPGP